MSNDQPNPGAVVSPPALDPAADPASWAPVAPGPRCPWCSAALSSDGLSHCPACNAQLAGGSESGLPGLTEVAPTARPAPLESIKRNRLLAWISGEVLDDPGPASTSTAAPDALAPPSRDVRREILRLQLEAAGIQISAEEPAEPAEAVPPAADGAADAAPIADAGPASDRESTAA